jgi:Xaa-Pro aminopeptidase
MTTRRVALLLALGGVTLTAASLLWAADESTAKLETRLQGLIQQRVATAQRVMEANQATYELGRITLDLVIWSHRELAEARLAAAKTAAEREAALQNLFVDLQRLEVVIEARHKLGLQGADASQLMMISLVRQTAEIQLLEEQLRTAAAK